MKKISRNFLLFVLVLSQNVFAAVIIKCVLSDYIIYTLKDEAVITFDIKYSNKEHFFRLDDKNTEYEFVLQNNSMKDVELFLISRKMFMEITYHLPMQQQTSKDIVNNWSRSIQVMSQNNIFTQSKIVKLYTPDIHYNIMNDTLNNSDLIRCNWFKKANDTVVRIYLVRLGAFFEIEEVD